MAEIFSLQNEEMLRKLRELKKKEDYRRDLDAQVSTRPSAFMGLITE